MRRNRILFAAITVLVGSCLLSAVAEAGAWPREPGEQLLIRSVSIHRLDEPLDESRTIKRELALYGEYGLTRRLTLVGRLAVQDFTGPRDTGPKTGASSRRALGGSELGARLHLASWERWVVSAHAVVTLPSPGENQPNSARGEGGGDWDFRAIAGRSFGSAGFLEAQLGWRERGGVDGSELRFDTAIGFPVSERNRLCLQTYSIWSTGLDTTRMTEFSGHRTQLSLVRDMGRGRALQLGVLSTVEADNMARELALVAGVWRRF